MKKIFLALIFAGMTAMSAQAQTYFAGGALGVDYNGGKYSFGAATTNKPATTSFEISPMLGYYLSKDLGVGVMINVGMSNRNNRADDPTKSKSFDWGFSPFLRYTVLTRGDFSILMQGSAGVFGSSTKVTYGTTTDKGPKTFGFDISVVPLLSYNLTSRVSLEVSSNMARFGFSVQTEKTGSGDSQQKETESSFGFGVDSFDFFRSPYQIGMIFKF
jgi:hypothetical protein